MYSSGGLLVHRGRVLAGSVSVVLSAVVSAVVGGGKWGIGRAKLDENALSSVDIFVVVKT